jgi:hypothetical protein
MDVNLLKSDRTTFTFGGEGFGIWRKAKGLIGMQGYDLHGTVQHRISRRTTIGATYQHSHYDFPKAFGESDINAYSGIVATQLGQYWTAKIQGGAYQAEVQGLQRVAVDPAIAALFGVSSTVQTFYRKSIFPQWEIGVNRRFQRADFGLFSKNGVSGGNGVYLTSREETEGVSFGYNATRKWSFSASAGYSRLDGIGQNLKTYAQFNGGGGVTYAIASAIHAFARYDNRHQEITDGVYRQNSYRTTFGISFSPGDVPLAFH